MQEIIFFNQIAYSKTQLMLFEKINFIHIATNLFIASIIIAHILAPTNYDWTKNTISDLGAQGYNRKYIMQLGFLMFGFILSTGLISKGLSWRIAPIFIYALSVGLTGVFCTKPFTTAIQYSIFETKLHSIFAQLAGIAFSLGILAQVFFSKNIADKKIHCFFFFLIILLSASFGFYQNFQGIIQRLLYAISFLWLLRYFKS